MTPELALTQAREAESEIAAGRYRGPMHGIPFGLKGIYNTAGIRTTAHSKIYRDNIPPEDATTTAKLVSAGGVLMGKLATHEFAIGGPSHIMRAGRMTLPYLLTAIGAQQGTEGYARD